MWDKKECKLNIYLQYIVLLTLCTSSMEETIGEEGQSFVSRIS